MMGVVGSGFRNFHSGSFLVIVHHLMRRTVLCKWHASGAVRSAPLPTLLPSPDANTSLGLDAIVDGILNENRNLPRHNRRSS
jgi:hypothetical protein